MKTQEELNALKEEIKALNRKLAELTEEELKQVVGGTGDHGITYMLCIRCEYSTSWGGNYLHKIYTCPNCHKPGLKGVSYKP